MTKSHTSSARAPWLRALLVALAVGTPAAMVTTTMGSAPAVAQAGPEGEVDLETFHRELAPYGKWFEHPKWGEVWRPDVENDWRPYTRGHWSWTDEHGWYWVAEEQWGWGPFHYGRWVFDDEEEEWLWIPGTEWAPAWVQWRESEDNVGWAPLPPDSLLDGGSLRHNATAYDSPRYSRYWVFAAPSVMFLPGLYRHIVPVSRYSTVWRNTRHVSFHHRIDRGRIFHPGIDHRRIGRWAGRTVPVVTLRPVGSARDTGWRSMRSQTEVPVFRPRVVTRSDFARPSRPVWGTERREGRPQVNVTPRPDWQRGGDGRDGGRDGRDGGRSDWNRDRADRDRNDRDRNDRDRNDRDRNDGNRDRRGDYGRGDDATRRLQEQARQLQQQQQEQGRRQQDQARQQLEAGRAQQEALRRQQEAARQQQDVLRQQQEAARRQQDNARQEALRRQQDAVRQQQDATRQQQEAARRQQEAARLQQEAARRQQEQARQAAGSNRGPGVQPAQPAPDARRGDGQGRGGEGRGEGRRGDGRRNQDPDDKSKRPN